MVGEIFLRILVGILGILAIYGGLSMAINETESMENYEIIILSGMLLITGLLTLSISIIGI